MKSPFAIFRKHRKVLTVILTGLAMFAFILMDQVMQAGSGGNSVTGLTVLFAVISGAGVLWVLGTQAGKPKEYALAGAIAGAALGFVLLYAGDSGAVVKTNVGNLTQRDLHQLINRRQVANRFVMSVFQSARAGQEMQFANPQRFLFDFGRPQQEDVVLGYLLQAEAREMGLTVTDGMIGDFIREVATISLNDPKNGPQQVSNLPVSEYQQILRNMRISEAELYDSLREQLLARMALELLLPRDIQTPEQYWQFFRKMHVTQKLEAAALPAEAFVDETAEPSEADLRQYFEEHKAYYPNQIEAGSPGFRQPRKIDIGYVQADYLTVEREVLEAIENDPDKARKLEEEIQAYYEKNKGELYRKEASDSRSDLTFPDDAEKDQPAAEGADSASPEATDNGKDDSLETSPDASQSAPEVPNGAEGDPSESSETAPEQPDVDDQQNPEAETGDSVEQDKGPATGPEATSSATPPDENAVPEADASQEQPATDSDQGESAEKSATEEQTAAQKPSDTAEAADEKSDETDKPVEYRELDDELRSEIRAKLLRERTFARMQEKIDQVVAKMRDLGLKYTLPEGNPDRLTAEQVEEELREFARTNGLGRLNEVTGEIEDAYVTTGLMSADALQNSEDHRIGQAVLPDETSSLGDSPSILQRLFGTTQEERLVGGNDNQTHLPDYAVDPVSENRFAYWKVEDVAGHVPELDDPGVRELVLKTWRLQQARERAQKRAAELAETVKAAGANGQGMTEALDGKTVTGADGATLLTVLPTNRFSWLRLPTAGSPNPFQPQIPELSSVDFIPKAGSEFMKVVFDDLGDGEVGVAADAEKSVYYVVKVKDRTPSAEGGLASLREQFMQTNFFPTSPFFLPPYFYLASEQQRGVNAEWSEQLETKYRLTWIEQPSESLAMGQ